MLEAREQEKSRVSRTQEQGERSRQKILDAAEALIVENGFAATSISAVCQRSGLPASSIYWHFESKRGLLTAVLERGANRWIDEIGSPRDYPGNSSERLSELMRRGTSAFESHPREFIRLQMVVALEGGESAEAARGAMLRVRERMATLIEDALFEVFVADHPAEISREAAAAAARFLRYVADGIVMEEQITGDAPDTSNFSQHAEVAALAIGRRVLARGTGTAS